MTPPYVTLAVVFRAAVSAVLLALALSACAVAPNPTKAPSAGAGATCIYRSTNTPAKAVDPPPTSNVPNSGVGVVTLTFASGPVEVTVDRAAAPCTANSFESLAQQGFFTNTTCHRMSSGGGYRFLQCGDPTGTGRGGPGYWFDDELSHTKAYTEGVVAMANSGRNTNGSQFFIVFGDSPFPPNYTVFGRIDAKGLAVLQAMGEQGTDKSEAPMAGRPLANTTITQVTVG